MNFHAFGKLLPMLNGIPLTGFAEGDDVINIKRNSDTFGHKVGADGKMTTYRSSDKSGTVTMKFMQGSEASKVFDTIFSIQASVTAPFVPAVFTLLNTTTGESVVAVPGYIKRPADWVRGTNVNEEEWEFVCEDLFIFRTVSSVLGTAIDGLASIAG